MSKKGKMEEKKENEKKQTKTNKKTKRPKINLVLWEDMRVIGGNIKTQSANYHL
jgi:hypothetical protein